MELETIWQLFLAMFLGALIGLEREIKKREAGLQTYSLVALASCLFTLSILFLNKINTIKDPSVLIIGIGVGMGFIGAGAISRINGRVEGITTAAGLWTTAAIGLAIGSQFYFLAISATLVTLLILSLFGFIEKKYFEKKE